MQNQTVATLLKQRAAKASSKAGSALVSGLITLFVLPFIALLAWNGLTPESFPDWNYWPTLAGLLVIRVVLSWVGKANDE